MDFFSDVRKIKPLLEAIESRKIPVSYYALDLAREPLEIAVQLLSSEFKFVQCKALWASFEDCLNWLDQEDSGHARLYLSLGSSLGNGHFNDAVEALKAWRERAFTRPDDRMLLSMDGTEDLDVVWHSYHDDQGLFEKFIRNGYEHSIVS
ncbi:hypothetical protein MRB53_042334 [Persea americana]|nr:hypothetical protein MRB53_042334 [Persea americana]